MIATSVVIFTHKELRDRNSDKHRKEEMMFTIDRDLLLYKVKQANTTYDAICKELGIDRSTLYRHLRDESMTVAEVHKLIRILNLTTNDVIAIFLAPKVA
jgi:transcriptional regulator of acetoin/glycerol metabolism